MSLQESRKRRDQAHFDAATRWLEARGNPRCPSAGLRYRWTVRPKSGFLGASQVQGGNQKKPLTRAQIRDLYTHREPKGPERLPRKERRRLERQNRPRRRKGSP